MNTEKESQIIQNLITIKKALEREGYDVYADWVGETINYLNKGEK